VSEQVESCTQTILPATPGWYVATLCKGRGELLSLCLRRPFHLRIKIPGPSCDSPRCALALVGRKYDCLERHPTWIAAEFLTQSLHQGVDDSIRIDAAARLYLVN
jgi:hypothetical protein